LYNSGARISELLALKVQDIGYSDTGRCRITVLGKGRKERCLPLWPETAGELADVISLRGLGHDDFVFYGRNVEHLTRSGAQAG
jgi:site-specific recombinase XerC